MQERWLRLHLAFAPFGTILVTWLLSLAVGAWEWHIRNNMELAGQLMPMGAACYAAAILVIERTAKMFWALAQRDKEREKWQKEGLEKGLEKGLAEGLAEGRENERVRIERELAEQGIQLPPEAMRIIQASPNGADHGKSDQE